jgi:hypothetical protein
MPLPFPSSGLRLVDLTKVKFVVSTLHSCLLTLGSGGRVLVSTGPAGPCPVEQVDVGKSTFAQYMLKRGQRNLYACLVAAPLVSALASPTANRHHKSQRTSFPPTSWKCQWSALVCWAEVARLLVAVEQP